MEVIKLDDFPINPIQDQIYEIIPDKTKIVASTNRLFNKYPTRYISAVPRFAINAYSKAGETVLDPFCGSGTTAIEAMLLGRNAMSIDIDPFARLLIKVKTTVYSKEDIDFLDEVVRKIKEMSPDESFQYPIPGIPNIEKWFCDKSILWLSFFKYTIDKLAADNQNVKDYLYVVLSGIIRKVSNADEVSPKPYISTKYPKTPADPSELFFKVENIKNFFVVAPNTTIYDKRKKDLNNNNSPKYVFRGLGCFPVLLQIITDDDYRDKSISLYDSDIHIFIYNIDKFNKESANMRKVNELLGDSFYRYLSNLPDLVLIMDESHHYRAERGAQALNDLYPLLGLALTAPPYNKRCKTSPFQKCGIRISPVQGH